MLFLLVWGTGCDSGAKEKQLPGFFGGSWLHEIQLDSSWATGDVIHYSFRDTFDLADWHYHHELSYYLAANSSFGEWTKDFDTLHLVFAHDTLQFELLLSENDMADLVQARKLTPGYWSFISRFFHEAHFRGTNIILSHCYGKAGAKEPQDALIYNEPIFPFLLEMGGAADNEALLAEKYRVLEKVIACLRSDQNGEEMAGMLEMFWRDVQDMDRPE